MSNETFGSYQLLRKLATGGMAEIYLARKKGQEGFEKRLVVKRILPHLAENPEFVQMFLHEARVAARLNHPNIAQIFDLGAEDDSYFIAMEYIHGEDVRRVWKQSESLGRELPVPLVVRIVAEACAGLDYAHKRLDEAGRPLNIVHRDVSPQNILVSFEGGVKVVDFGIAKAADQATVTRSGVLKGKYSYMSPEQAAGKRVDCRTDVFAIGVVLYELLTGARLFKRASDVATLNAVVECKVAPPSQVSGRLPADLDAIVMKALARDAADRYPEAVALQVALEEWLVRNGQPASSAHLAAFMQEIYAEQLAEASRLSEVGARPDGTAVARSGARAEEARSRQSGSRSHPGRGEEVSSREGTAAARPARSGASRSETPSRPSHSEPSLPRRTVDLRRAPTTPPQRPLPPLPVPDEEDLLSDEPPTRSGPLREEGGELETLSTRTPLSGPQPAAAKKGGLGARLAVGLGAVAALGLLGFLALGPALEAGRKGRGEGPPEVPRVARGAEPSAAKDEPAPPERPAPVAAQATLTLTSVPAGARVWVEGEARGTTPLQLQAAPGQRLRVRLEAEGYRPLEETLTVAAEAVQTRSLTLAAEPARARPAAARAPTRTVTPPPRPPEKPAGKGTVRFFAVPWAAVQCNELKLGTTPFEDQELPAGTYRCSFSNPEFPVTWRTVEVRAGEKTKVSVVFGRETP